MTSILIVTKNIRDNLSNFFRRTNAAIEVFARNECANSSLPSPSRSVLSRHPQLTDQPTEIPAPNPGKDRSGMLEFPKLIVKSKTLVGCTGNPILANRTLRPIGERKKKKYRASISSRSKVF